MARRGAGRSRLGAVMGVALKDFETGFWRMVKKTRGCWLWCGGTIPQGTGIYQGGRKGKVRQVHRISYELLVGHVPAGMDVVRTCKHPACVKPTHLVLQTLQQRGQHRKGVYGKAKATEVMRLRSLGWKQEAMAKELGVSIYFIRGVSQGRTWRNVTGLKPNPKVDGQPWRKRS
jgi:hypothetical protein